MLGVTEATGICDIEAEEKLEYEEAQEVIGEEEVVTGEFLSRLGEFSHAFRADSILRGHKTRIFGSEFTRCSNSVQRR